MIPFEIDMLHARHRKPRASGDDPRKSISQEQHLQ